MVPATAAKMPIGANFITMLVNLNITSDRPSLKPSIVSLARPGLTWVRAAAKSTEKNTTWSTSFFDAASKKLCGTVCSSTPDSVTGAFWKALASSADTASDTPSRRAAPG